MKLIHIAIAFITAPAWLIFGAIYNACFDKRDNPWVISGHRGRMKCDNAGAIFDYINENTDQEIIWIGATDQNAAFNTGRNSLKSRFRLFTAPVIIYSHGEDDLDICARAFRPVLGKRVYVGHGTNFLKMTNFYIAGRKVSKRFSAAYQWIAGLDYDALLAMNEREKSNWDKVFPRQAHKHIARGGAARFDRIRSLSRQEPAKQIVWLPTFRESQKAEAQLWDQIFTVAHNTRLIQWLESSDYRLLIGHHINSTDYNAHALFDSPHVGYIRPEDWIVEASNSSLLISDYSSILVDWLFFDRPAIFASFDLSEYSKVRGFHESYKSALYGPQAMNPEELIEIICSNEWENDQVHAQRRQDLRNEIFGDLLGTDQTALSYRIMCNLLEVPQRDHKRLESSRSKAGLED